MALTELKITRPEGAAGTLRCLPGSKAEVLEAGRQENKDSQIHSSSLADNSPCRQYDEQHSELK